MSLQPITTAVKKNYLPWFASSFFFRNRKWCFVFLEVMSDNYFARKYFCEYLIRFVLAAFQFDKIAILIKTFALPSACMDRFLRAARI